MPILNSEILTAPELLTAPENKRLSILPIRFPQIWKAFKEQQAAYWTVEEISLDKDYDDFQKLNKNEQHFVKMVLAFFSSSDNIVNINLAERFINDVTILEAKTCYSWQMMIEGIHAHMYALQIDNIIRDTDEKNKLFNAIEHYDCVRQKAQWVYKWIHSDETFAKRLIAMVIVEMVFFSGSFCSIFWLKRKNLMPGLISSNQLISADERSHCMFAVLLYSMIENRISTEEVHEMFHEAVAIESIFITESLPCDLLGINKKSMIEYIQYVADYLLKLLKYPIIWGATNPFDFMESISLEGKTNFFEHRPTQYQHASVLNSSLKNTFVRTEKF